MPLTISEAEQNDLHILDLAALLPSARINGGIQLESIEKDIKKTITTCDQLYLFLQESTPENKKYVIDLLGKDFFKNISRSELQNFAIFKNEGLSLYVANLLSQVTLQTIFNTKKSLYDLRRIPDLFEICQLIGSDHIQSIFENDDQSENHFRFSDFLSIVAEDKRMMFITFLRLDAMKAIIPDGKNLLFTLNLLPKSDRQILIRNFKKRFPEELVRYQDEMENYLKHEKIKANDPYSEIYAHFLKLTSHYRKPFFFSDAPTSPLEEGKLEEEKEHRIAHNS